MPKAQSDKQLEKNIPKAIQAALGIASIPLERIAKGEVNKVYKVTTTESNVLLRIFRKKGWVSKQKIEWIEQELAKHHVPHAKLLYFSDKATYFPYGFMLTEFVEGQNCSDAITAGSLSFDDFHNKLGTLLRKVHQVRTAGFGSIPNNGKNKSFSQYVLGTIRKTFSELKTIKDLDKQLYKRIETKLYFLLKPLEHKLKPVLTHGDPGPDNCILNSKGQVILIDWDAAQASVWVRDYADLRLSGAHMTHIATLEERRERIAKAFLAGHTRLGLSGKELMQVEQAFHIIISANSLSYYYNLQKNYEAYHKNLQRLKSLI